MDPPSGRVPEQGPYWFLVATEACGSGTPDLGYFLEVWGFIGEVGVKNKSGAPQEVHEAGGHPSGVGAPSTLMGPTGLPSGSFLFQYFLYFPKIFSIDFQRIPRTSISAQIQYHGSSAENSISPG